MRLGVVLKLIKNGLSGKQNKTGEGVPVTRIETISAANIDFDRVGYIPELDEEQKEKHLLERGDILFSHINSGIHIGKTALFDSESELYHGVNLLLLRTFPRIIKPSYLNLFLTSRRFNGYFESIARP